MGPERAIDRRLTARLRLIAQIESNITNGGPIFPNYNPTACLRFDIISGELDIFIQHAENIGEFRVHGYWVDGYDKEHNTVYEWDEPHHFNKDGSLKERDIYRQKEITEFLGCEFIRIKAWV